MQHRYTDAHIKSSRDILLVTLHSAAMVLHVTPSLPSEEELQRLAMIVLAGLRKGQQGTCSSNSFIHLGQS